MCSEASMPGFLSDQIVSTLEMLLTLTSLPVFTMNSKYSIGFVSGPIRIPSIPWVPNLYVSHIFIDPFIVPIAASPWYLSYANVLVIRAGSPMCCRSISSRKRMLGSVEEASNCSSLACTLVFSFKAFFSPSKAILIRLCSVHTEYSSQLGCVGLVVRVSSSHYLSGQLWQ